MINIFTKYEIYRNFKFEKSFKFVKICKNIQRAFLDQSWMQYETMYQIS